MHLSIESASDPVRCLFLGSTVVGVVQRYVVAFYFIYSLFFLCSSMVALSRKLSLIESFRRGWRGRLNCVEFTLVGFRELSLKGKGGLKEGNILVGDGMGWSAIGLGW